MKAAPTSDWLTEFSDAEETLVNSASGSEIDSLEPAPTFFRSFIFSPEVPIRLDYQGKRVDMEQVNKIAFRINFKPRNCVTNVVRNELKPCLVLRSLAKSKECCLLELYKKLAT